MAPEDRVQPVRVALLERNEDNARSAEMEAEIGHAAGTIWRYLDRHGEASLTQIRHGTKLSDPLVSMGLGWLAREGKVTLIKDKRSVRVSLTGG